MVAMTDRTGQSEAMTSAMRRLEAAFLIGVPDTTEVWLIRHADCYEAMRSHQDPPLSEIGRDQARRLGERVNRAGYDAIYSSPLRRAQETAAAISGGLTIDERLVEVSTELADGHVEFTEPADRVVERMRASVDDAVARHPGDRVIMVGHGVAIFQYLCHLLDIQFGNLRIFPYYTCVNVVRALGERRMVGSLADVAHLEARRE
jgi:broad specificity phosphatase PhoE